MQKYPMKFTVLSEGAAGIHTPWKAKTKSTDQEIPVAIPPEFDGPGNGLSPEDLYALALQNCFIATFKVFAEKSRLLFNSIRVESVLEVDRNEIGHPWMARIHLNVILFGAEQKENALRILEKTSQSCMILNSVKTEKTFKFDFTE